MRFIKGNELKLTQVELFSFIFLREYRESVIVQSQEATNSHHLSNWQGSK